MVLCCRANLDDAAIFRLNQLVRNGTADINCFDLQKRTPLVLLCAYNKGESFMQAFEILLERPDIDLNGKGRDALDLICSRHDARQAFAAIKRLIERGLDVRSDLTGRRSLCTSFSDGQEMLPILRFLIKHGLDVHASN